MTGLLGDVHGRFEPIVDRYRATSGIYPYEQLRRRVLYFTDTWHKLWRYSDRAPPTSASAIAM